MVLAVDEAPVLVAEGHGVGALREARAAAIGLGGILLGLAVAALGPWLEHEYPTPKPLAGFVPREKRVTGGSEADDPADLHRLYAEIAAERS